MRKFFKDQWEQVFFGAVGLFLLMISLYQILFNKLTDGSAIFAMAFFCFFYSNIARFKRFKGLGFEAELWEDKQNEAEEMIERLKSIVAVYTREIVLGKVRENRWGGGGRWHEIWSLYQELVERHTEIGQKIDFGDLKENIEKYFVFDICTSLYEEITHTLWRGVQRAQKNIGEEFGSPVRDIEAYNNRGTQLREIKTELSDIFQIAQTDNLAQRILDLCYQSKQKLYDYFSIEVEFKTETIELLKKVSFLYEKGHVPVTEELIKIADRG